MASFALVDSVAAVLGLGRDITQSLIEWSQRARLRSHNSNFQKRFRLEVIADNTDNTDNTDHHVDICFVHGLDGDWKFTWTDEQSGIFWPKDLLPSEPAIGSTRVLSYGYDTMFPTTDYLTTRTLYHHANQLVEELCIIRAKDNDCKRPIIFIGHGLGGIVIQSAFILSSASGDERLRSVCLSTAGVVFLGTPFRGVQDHEWVEWFSRLVRSSATANGVSLSNLEHDSKSLKNMLQPFIAASFDIPICGFQPKLGDKSHQVRFPADDSNL